MTPNAKTLKKSIQMASDQCRKVILTILDALDDAEYGSGRIRQENPGCSVEDIEKISEFILRASNAVEMADIMLDLAMQKLKEKACLDG